MNSLGIYFGTSTIGLVESKGRKLVNNVIIPQANISVGDFEEKVPVDIKMIALLKDAFRTYRINSNAATICLSGQDLIIRTFEIPTLPQNELRSAINFEVKKYIPFKLEELVYDFQVESNKKNKTSMVLFVGAKKEVLDSYISVSNQLNLKINAIEYSAFSLQRFLRLSGAQEAGVLACLCFDLDNEDEINFMVFKNGFPLFTRDIILTAGPGDLDKNNAGDLMDKQEKLKNEIRISQEYYRRKFPEDEIKKFFVISGKETNGDLGAFFAEAGQAVKFVDSSKVLGQGAAYSSVIAKGFGAAIFKEFPLKVKVDLLGSRLKADKASGGVDVSMLLQGFKLDPKVVFLGILICVVTFGYGFLKMQPASEELSKITGKRPKVITVSVDDSYESLSDTDKKFKNKLDSLDKLIKNQFYATYPLDIIPRALPKGAWLTNFSLTQKDDGKLELTMDGLVYLGDSDKEFEAAGAFLSNLRSDKIFSKYFTEITIASVDRKQFLDSAAAVFSIVCRNYTEIK